MRSAASSSGGFAKLDGLTAEEWRKLLGRKVSVRYRLHGDPSTPFSEAIGMVSAVNGDEPGRVVITILNRRGQTSEVPLEDLVAGKAWL